jgi:predicted outer membrane repeat protein
MSARSIRRQANRRTARERARNAAIASAVALGSGAALASSAEAATFNVTNLNDDGPGSLRAAITAANLTAAADTITFASNLTGTIELTTGGIPIEAALDIQGPGADVLRVSATDSTAHFAIDTDTTGATYDDVSISGLKFIEGNGSSGGSISVTESDVALRDVVFKGNYASSTGGAVDFDDGDLSITNSTFTGNSSSSGGGAVYFDGDTGTDDGLVIRDSKFTGNGTASDGGAVYFDNGGEDLLVERSTFTANTSEGDGGAFDIYDPSTDADRSAVIRDSLLSGNTASDDEGGAIYYDGGNATAANVGLLVENTTISGNRAYSGIGGGVYVGDTDAKVQFTSATITDNSTTDSGDGGGIYSEGTENIGLTNTIVADNSASGSVEDDLGSDGAVAGDGSFVINNSLIGDDISPAGSNILNSTTAPGSNIFETDPKLGPLADNGGPTLTHLPSLTSPVIDAGSTALTTDQRGLTRPVDRPVANKATSNGSDMGAVEVQADPDTAVNGGTIEVPNKVKVKKKVKIKVTAGSAENATATVSGEVTSGDLVFDLKSQTGEIAAGGVATFNLVPAKKKSNKKIAKLLSPKKGKAKKVNAEIELQLVDKAGNEATLTDKTKLKGKKKKKK